VLFKVPLRARVQREISDYPNTVADQVRVENLSDRFAPTKLVANVMRDDRP